VKEKSGWQYDQAIGEIGPLIEAKKIELEVTATEGLPIKWHSKETRGKTFENELGPDNWFVSLGGAGFAI
jgi:hypothetical protein